VSALRVALDDYLAIRRRLGFTMPQDGRLIEGFVAFLDRAGASRITTELALTWARLPVDVHPFTWRQRLIVARGFARYLATVDPDSEVPPVDLLPGHRPRITPYVYSEAEITALMAAARGLRPALRAARHETLIGLLAVTGCRPAEALGLDRADVDLDNGVVHVRVGKKNKQRDVPVHPSTVGALRGYAGLRDAHCPTPSTPAFFLSARGRRMGREELNATFIKLVRQVGLEGAGSRARPRPYDLRHAFAVHTLIDWYRSGENVDRRMPLLSTYLGHVDPASTYWYLESVPELLQLVTERMERIPGASS
jgi:integrase/recombinase XerD